MALVEAEGAEKYGSGRVSFWQLTGPQEGENSASSRWNR
jgi:hypothetical protein